VRSRNSHTHSTTLARSRQLTSSRQLSYALDNSRTLSATHELSATLIRTRQLSHALGNFHTHSTTLARSRQLTSSRQLSYALDNSRMLSATLTSVAVWYGRTKCCGNRSMDWTSYFPLLKLELIPGLLRCLSTLFSCVATCCLSVDLKEDVTLQLPVRCETTRWS